MSEEEIRVASLIREAFRGVKLGAGVGLMQAQGLDDYADQETLARYRAGDEKDECSRIAADDLNGCYSSLSFFDAEGMRFHLPAYLIADLDGTFQQDVLFTLTYLELDNPTRFSLLSSAQRRAVREFLLLRLSQDEGFARPLIEKALAEYWLPVGDEQT